MDAKQIYSSPVLVELGEVVSSTRGDFDHGDEAITMKFAGSDI